MNRFGVERGACRSYLWKLGLAAVGLSAAGLGSVWAAQTQSNMALGLIVKLKESAPQSVVRLSASVRPSDGERAQRQRLYSASTRTRVGFTAQKPTAFGAHVIHSGRITSVAEAEAEAQRLRQDPDVEWVVVNQYEKPSAVARVSSLTPSLNAAYNDQYWLKDKAAGGAGVAGFSTAWSLINGSGRQLGAVVTAVLDTGVLAPPELQGRLASPGYDFVSQANVSNDGNGVDPDPSDPGDYNYDASLCGPEFVGNSTWHGTSVTGILTSPANNNRLGPGVLSVLPGAVVLPVRIGGPCGALVSDIVEGMLWAAGVDYQGAPSTINSNPARVINLSFGGRDSITEDGSCLASTSTGALYRSTVSILRQKGAVVVASAGNGKSNGTYTDGGGQSQTRFTGYRTPGRPASCEGVVAVTALRSDGTKSEYANLVDGNVGSAGYVGLSVAGGDPEAPEYLKLIMNAGVSAPNATYYLSNEAGTSFSAPQVAGLIALMFAIDPSLTAQQAIDLVTTSATSFPNPGAIQSCSVNTGALRGHCACDTATCGAGIVDAGAAVAAALAGVAGRPSNDTSADFVPPTLYASFFTPNRVLYNERARPGSGGGGASELSTLLPLVGVAIFMLALPAWQRFQRRPTSGERLKTGKR